MKVLSLLLLIAVVFATECPNGNCGLKHSPGLPAATKNDIYTTNIHHVEKLDVFPRKCIVNFLKELNLHDTTIKLGHVIRGGHSVMYTFTEGKSPELVSSIAAKHHLKVLPSKMCKCQNCCGRLILPGKNVNIVDAVPVPGKRQLRANMPKKGGMPPFPVPRTKQEKLEHLHEVKKHSMLTQQQEDKQRTKFFKLDDTQKQWYHDNNVAQATKMNARAQPLIKKFIEDLNKNAKHTVVHFMEPIRDGFSVRFTMVEGSKDAVRKYANQCGLQLKGRTLVAPGGSPKHAENTLDTDKKSHIVVGSEDQTDAGYNKPVKRVDNSKRNVVKQLPDKWIETKLLEEDEDADAFVAEPKTHSKKHQSHAHKKQHQPHAHSDDDDALIQIYQ